MLVRKRERKNAAVVHDLSVKWLMLLVINLDHHGMQGRRSELVYDSWMYLCNCAELIFRMDPE